MRTSWGSATDRGRVRRLNEDAHLAQAPVFLVADGMGGHDAGDVASRVTVEEFSRLCGRDGVTHDDVAAAFARAAGRVREAVGHGRTAGTTVAGVAVAAGGAPYWLVFNVGDSRVYRLAGGALEQVSVDHSVVQELIDEGRLRPADAQWHPDRHVITRAVGTGAVAEPDFWLIPAGAADRLLLCSDGLTQELDDDAIRYLLLDQPEPQAAAQILVQAAVEAGGRDNVTVVVVDIGDAHPAGVDEATIERAVPPGDGTEGNDQ